MFNHKYISIILLLSSIFGIAVYANNNQANIDHGTRFENVSELLDPFKRQGLDHLGGIAWLDYDQDKDLDLFITGGKFTSNALFRNNGDGTFTDVTQSAGLYVESGSLAAVAGDIDNDGYPDLFVTGDGNIINNDISSGTQMYHNNGNGSFTDISATANVPGSITTMSAAMADVNNDGYLDLFVTGPGHAPFLTPPPFLDVDRLYINNGNLTFTDVTDAAGVAGGLGSCAVSFSDYNTDGWQDIIVAVCNDPALADTPFHLYENNQDGTFTDVASVTGMDILGLWMSVAMGDFDNDGDFDIFSTNVGKFLPRGAARHVLMQNNGDGTYTDIAPDIIGLTEFAWGSTFADWDNDGWLDLFFTGSFPNHPAPFFSGSGFGNPGRMFFNDGVGGFVEDNAAHGLNLETKFPSAVSRADFDNDGFMDLAIATSEFERINPATGDVLFSGDGTTVLIQNEGNDNRWVTIRLRGIVSNRMGIGAVLKLRTPDGLQQLRQVQAGSSFGSSETPWPTFGMGKQKKGMLTVTWPSGLVESYRVRSNRTFDIREGKGSKLKD